MIIDRIESLDQRRSKVFLDGDFAFVLYQGEIARYHLEAGGELAEETYRELLWQIVGRRAREKALSLLKTQGRTEEELRRKLDSFYYPEAVVAETIHFLKEYHYLDDREYSRNYVELYSGKKSRAELEFALKNKGVDRELIREVLSETVPDNRSAIESQLRKKGYHAKMTPQEQQKIITYLLRRGFSWEEIRASMNDLTFL